MKNEECLSTPEDAHNYVMDLLDEVFDRVDRAVDEGQAEIKRLKPSEAIIPKVKCAELHSSREFGCSKIALAS